VIEKYLDITYYKDGYMRKFAKQFISATLFTLMFTSTSASFADTAKHEMLTPSNMKWTMGPASLPKGAQVTVLEGDPTQAGPFTIRLKFPANYRIAPHWHPGTEHLTVISGTFFLGMGDQLNEKEATALPVGSFALMSPETHHYAFTRAPAIIQLHGEGPWGITFIDNKDNTEPVKPE
jgi:quercetin dioxygenase-like cupin family protein